jgi:class 3 adenylate cyclase
LVINATNDPVSPIGGAHYLAEQIPGARLLEYPGETHFPSTPEGWAVVIDEIEEFVTGTRTPRYGERALATVLFTDMVGSTNQASELGDRKWAALLQLHNARVRAELGRFRGREVDLAGNGFLATFDGPARAVRCASAMVNSVKALGIQIRVGLHTGECELVGGQLRGVAVHTGVGVAAVARPGEILVSSTVKDLVAGSGLEFEDRGIHILRGVPGELHLYAVAPG